MKSKIDTISYNNYQVADNLVSVFGSPLLRVLQLTPSSQFDAMHRIPCRRESTHGRTGGL